MKKILLSGAAIALFATVLVSCGENKEAKTETAATTEAEKPAEPAVATPTNAGDAPTFSSEEVNKGLADYKTLMDEYVKAIADKDQAKIAELGQKYSTWAQGAATWAQKLKPEETQQFSEYMQKLAKQWTDAAANAAK